MSNISIFVEPITIRAAHRRRSSAKPWIRTAGKGMAELKKKNNKAHNLHTCKKKREKRSLRTYETSQ